MFLFFIDLKTCIFANGVTGGYLPYGLLAFGFLIYRNMSHGGRHKKTSIAMKKLLRHSGIALVVIGGLTLVASQLAGWTDINGVQQAGLGLIIAGIFVHVAIVKRQSQY